MAAGPLLRHAFDEVHCCQHGFLEIYASINIVLIAFAIARPGMHGAYAIVVSSFFLSIMFPTIFALGLKGLGPNTKLAGSFLVMAVAGGAVFPPILGWIAKQTGSVAKGYIVPLSRIRRCRSLLLCGAADHASR